MGSLNGRPLPDTLCLRQAFSFGRFGIYPNNPNFSTSTFSVMPSLSSRYYTWIVLSLVFIPLSTCLVALLLVDPLSLFHKPWLRDEYYIGDLRIQAAGIIRHTEFDSIILGSSMAANFSIQEASELWDANFVNLYSASMGWLSERSIILNYALKKKQLQNVIISLDGYEGFGEYNPFYPITNWNFLYNENPFDEISLYLGSRFLKYTYCRSSYIPADLRCQSGKDLEHLAEWPTMVDDLKRFGGIDNWLGGIHEARVRNALSKIVRDIEDIQRGTIGQMNQKEYRKQINDEQRSFDQYLFRHIQENPETKFHLFFPPYSRMRYAMMKQRGTMDFELYLERIRYAVEKVEEIPNGAVFVFDHLDFLDDLRNYKDTGHYHPRYNSKMLKWMNQQQYQLTTKKVSLYPPRY